MNNKVLKALKSAFPSTIPVLTGFGFLGISYGIYMKVSGFSFIYPLCISLLVYGGSLQFVIVELLLSAYNPIATFMVALMVQARHLFYGIAMLDKLNDLGWKKWLVVFGMSDETFSIVYSADIPDDVDKGWYMLWVAILDYSYWALASMTGGILGSFITFSTEGIDFVMTAMFVVIFLNQWLKNKNHYSELFGVGASVLCLLVFGPADFLIPTMLLIVVLLTAFRSKVETKEETR